MPFLFNRIRENIFLFTVIGIIYSIIYNNIQMPDYQFALPISCGGFLVIAFILHEYFLYAYLRNIGDANIYLLTNSVAYAAYMVLFYLIYALAVFDIGFFRWLYSVLFTPYDLFVYAGLPRGLSSLAIHVAYMITVIVTPYFVKDNTVNPLEEYLNREE